MVSASVNGQDHELTLDWDSIVEYEKDNPGWNIVKELATEGGNNRLSEMDFIVGFVLVDGEHIDGGYRGFLRMGFKVSHLLDTYRTELQELGFLPTDNPSAE